MVLNGDPRQPGPSLEALARQARAGCDASFCRLVERLQVGLYRFLLLRTGSEADAEELTQESFVKAWQSIERYDDRWRFTTWLYTIARRQAASHHRRRVRRCTEEMPDGLDSGELDPSRVSSLAEQRDNLWDLARRVLNREQHTALWLRYAEDMQPGEIAAVLGKGASQLRVTLFRARRVLGRHLTREEQTAGHRPATPAASAAVSPSPCPEGP